MIPYPHQLEGARWMAEKSACLNAFEMRVGKTATAIIAADYRMARRIVVVTTASGRAVWLKAFRDWSSLLRTVGLGAGTTDVQVVSWGEVIQGRTLAVLMRGRIDVLILDESHNAKTFEAKRTLAVYGFPVGNGAVKGGLREHADAVWCLSGTPAPNALNDLYPMLAALSPSRLRAVGAAPDVSTYEAFLKRYCRVKPKKIGFHRWIDVVIGSRNEDELRGRMDGFVIRKTQADVGITLPIYELHPLAVSAKVRRQVEEGVDSVEVLRAAEAGDTKALEMHLGPLRRLTGEIKARAVAEVVRDEMAGGLDKIVLMGWHKDALALLRSELSQFGVVGIDGTTSADERARAERRFRDEPGIRVFVGQIQAAGEAIDLSAASELMFVESSLVPKDMAQASKRITNFTQNRQPRVRVATLQGSIDEALQDILMRKWAGIREVIR